MDVNQKSILEMARGAFQERADYEMSRIVDNILDANTKADAARKLTLTLTLKPDDSRQNIAISRTAKSTLATTNPVTTSLYVASSPATGEVQICEMVPGQLVPGQMDMYGGEQDTAPILKLVHTA